MGHHFCQNVYDPVVALVSLANVLVLSLCRFSRVLYCQFTFVLSLIRHRSVLHIGSGTTSGIRSASIARV